MSECRYFHATKGKLPLGEVLAARRHTPGRFETIVARYRPKGFPSRELSFYLAEKAETLLALGASSFHHVYAVEPVGNSYRADPNWLIEASHDWEDAGGRVTPLVERKIVSHWAGKKSSSSYGWEIVSPKMRVCAELSEKSKASFLLASSRDALDYRVFQRMLSLGMETRRNVTILDAARDLGLPAAVISKVEKTRGSA